MTGNTALLQFYDNVFTNEYKSLRQFAHYNEDQLHDVYCNVKSRLEKNHFNTGATINECYDILRKYIRKSIVIERRLEHKKKKDCRSITEDGYLYDAELQLNVLEEILEDNTVYANQVNYVMKNMFKYLDKYHDQYEIYVFKVYYFSGQKLNYDDMSILLNLKIWKIDKILKKIRKSLRENLIKYMTEQELYVEIKELMRTGIPRQKFYVALELYKKLHPDRVKNLCMGCQGKSIRIMAADFQTFLVLNKKKYE